MATVKLFNHHVRTSYLYLLVFEFGILFFSAYAGVYLRFQKLQWQPPIEDLENFPLKALIFSVILLVAMIAMGQYQSPGPRGKFLFTAILIRVFISLALGTLALFIIYYLFPQFYIGRGIFALALAFNLLLITAVRMIFYATADGRGLRRRILVIGAGKLATAILEKRDNRRALVPHNATYVIHGFVHIGDEKPQIPDEFLVRPGEDLASYCDNYEIDEVVLAIGDRRKTMPVNSLLDCKLSNINVIDFVAFWEREHGMLRIDMLNPSWMIFCDGCIQAGFSRVVYRLFDLVMSSLILIIMLPILIVVALLIYLENGFKGPVFYKQTRVGLNDKPFELLKFRSMVVNAESDGKAKWADKDDNRITWVGKFIRKVRIDELPQIINIFKGDMSLVGPRPERPEFVAELEKSIPYYYIRHSVKPGLAGWAQLKYPYGASEQDTYNKLQYDLFYVKNHSFLLDVLVLLQTVEVIILGKGAR